MADFGPAGPVWCRQDNCRSHGLGAAYVSRPIQAVSGVVPHPKSGRSGKPAPFSFLCLKQRISMKQIGTKFRETMCLRMSRQLHLRDYPTGRSFAGRPSGSGCRRRRHEQSSQYVKRWCMRELRAAQNRDDGGGDDDGTQRHTHDAAGGKGDQRCADKF